MPTYTLPFGQCVVSAEGLGLSPLLTSEQLSLSLPKLSQRLGSLEEQGQAEHQTQQHRRRGGHKWLYFI